MTNEKTTMMATTNENTVYDRYGRSFQVGQLVESVFDAGTVYRITKLHPPTHAGDYSTYLSLETVSVGVDTFKYSVSDNKGQMGDGRSYAPYHFKPATGAHVS